jgi:hypothetical protein
MVAGERAPGEVDLNTCAMPRNNLKQLFRDLKAGLKTVADAGGLSQVEKFKESVTAINDFLKVVRERVMTESFKDRLEEIYFFKFEKPEYYALRIYHLSLYALWKQRPVGTPAVLRAYYLEELRFIARFFKQHAFHYEYFRSGFTELDELLFVRGVTVSAALSAEAGDFDPDFATAGDTLFARFMAFEMLQDYIMGLLKELDEAQGSGERSAGRKAGLKRFDWSGEVINLVELGYGLYLSKQIGGGKVTLQEIFRWLEESFGLVIENPAMRFRDVKRRKRLSRTHFIDLLRDVLTRYMDEEFE